MPEHDALISNYQHLERLLRAQDALHMLRKIASLVKPIMRKRGWHVGTLTEFFPDQQNLLGLNVNHGQRICLRLRYPRDQTCFLPIEEVIDTMLHELSHNVHGPHDAKFHALWNELRDEYIDLKTKGYSGEGFLSDGKRLGGRNLPIQEMRRQARLKAEQRRTLQAGSGKKIGGAPVLQGVDMRAVIADAASRRSRITQGCASGSSNADQVGNDAALQGFKTKAEEDDANDRAVAQALWEVVQEEEDRKAGVEPEVWIRSDTNRATGLSWGPEKGLEQTFDQPQGRSSANTSGPPKSAVSSRPPVPNHSKPTPPPGWQNRDWNVLRPRTSGSRLISEEERKLRRGGQVDLTGSSESEDSAPQTPPENGAAQAGGRGTNPASTWACSVCTLVNPSNFLACDACGVERPLQTTSKIGHGKEQSSRSGRGPTMVPVPTTAKREGEKVGSIGWRCRRCDSFMESQWWTCSACGLMKASS